MELYNIVDHELDKLDNESYHDDIIYAELERRILVVINTAGESDSKDSRMARRANNFLSRGDENYFDWTETEDPPSSVPSTILNLWKSNVNGTGVFIPHLVESNKGNKSSRTGKKSENGRSNYKAKAVANKNKVIRGRNNDNSQDYDSRSGASMFSYQFDSPLDPNHTSYYIKHHKVKSLTTMVVGTTTVTLNKNSDMRK
ncbi:hypothetical protein AgCh_029682 [Apium graveolens]